MPPCGSVRLHLRSGFVLMTIKGLAVQDTASPFSLLLNEIGIYVQWAPQQRAVLNMHNLFISCQVCHVREQEEIAPTRFGWIDITNGQLRTGKSDGNAAYGKDSYKKL